MFTGIVTAVGTVRSLADAQLVLDAPGLDEPAGASVAVNGVCLTVASASDGKVLRFELLPATLQRTNLGQLEPGASVNLEPALRVGDRMGGHWLQGHVDAVGTIVSVQELDGATELVAEVPEQVRRYCIPQGSIAIDGVSLTIVELRAGSIAVQLVPETRTRTSLGAAEPGRRVNLEADVLARYVERMLVPYQGQPAQ